MVRPERRAPFDDGTILLVEVKNGLVGDGYYNVVASRRYFHGVSNTPSTGGTRARAYSR